MHLNRLKINGFRSFYDCTNAPLSDDPLQSYTSFNDFPGIEIPFEKLTVLIGCNDAGKSSVLDLLDILLNGGRPDADDFHLPLETFAQPNAVNPSAISEIYVLAEFQIHPDRDSITDSYGLDGLIAVCAKYTTSSAEIAYLAEVPSDERLRQDFTAITAAEQIALIEDIDPEVLAEVSNKQHRADWLSKYAQSSRTVLCWIPIPRGFMGHLPRFERYSSMDYDEPANLVIKTLRQVYESVIYEEIETNGTTIRRPIEALRTLSSDVDERIQGKVQELLGYFQRYNPMVRTISFDPTLDFAGGLKTGQFQIDDGRGLKYLSKLGDGTKRKMFIAVVDWDREVVTSDTTLGQSLPSIIRGYDEPDTNLDYLSQRIMFRSISQIARSPDSRIQAIACTHSPRLVDQAPAQSIRLLSWNEGQTDVAWLQTDDDPAIESYLTSVARELGLSNTLMFYERCFVLIEGSTEKNTLPLLYRTMYGHSHIEDGICLINVESNGAFKEFFKVMSRNRQHLCVIFADLDTETSPAGKKLAKGILLQSNFGQDFIDSNVIYVPSSCIGMNGNEFEASFSDDVLSLCLQVGWPRKDREWSPMDVSAMRSVEDKKFTDVIKTAVWEESEEDSKYWSKPELGNILGAQCTNDQIPDEVSALFSRARQIAEIE